MINDVSDGLATYQSTIDSHLFLLFHLDVAKQRWDRTILRTSIRIRIWACGGGRSSLPVSCAST
jgi:hypothetical protein